MNTATLYRVRHGFTIVGRPTSSKRAFTLIELLVVVTVIVVLLALLTPAMDQAIYQAELAQCSGRLKAAAAGTLQYTVRYQRHYPHRSTGRTGVLSWYPEMLASNEYDDRSVIFEAIDPRLLLDPFSGKIDIVNNEIRANVNANYELWFGWRFLTGQEKGMNRLGDRFTWLGQEYRILISDEDRLFQSSDQSTHPDRVGRMAFEGPYQDAVNPWPGWNLYGVHVTYSKWTSNTTGGARVRGPLDPNYGYDDGAVLRFDRVGFEDERMGYVPDYASHNVANYSFSRQIAR